MRDSWGRRQAWFVFFDGKGGFRIVRRGLRYLDEREEVPEGVAGPFGFLSEAVEWRDKALAEFELGCFSSGDHASSGGG